MAQWLFAERLWHLFICSFVAQMATTTHSSVINSCIAYICCGTFFVSKCGQWTQLAPCHLAHLFAQVGQTCCVDTYFNHSQSDSHLQFNCNFNTWAQRTTLFYINNVPVQVRSIPAAADGLCDETGHRGKPDSSTGGLLFPSIGSSAKWCGPLCLQQLFGFRLRVRLSPWIYTSW